MNIVEKKLPQGKLKLRVELTPEELTPYLQKAAVQLSEKMSIPGFRPGKAPYDVVKAQAGEAKLYQEAFQQALPKILFQVIQDKKLTTVGQPEVQIEKLAPGNPVIFTATVALMPEVNLGDWRTLKISSEQAVVTDAEVDKVINDFASWQAKEVAVDRPAQSGDKVEIDFEVLVDKVVIEGGKASKYPLILGSGSMIPGMEEQIVGLKNGEKKEFKLNFPAKYFQNHLAGKEAEFKVTVNSVLERQLPTIDDAWSQSLAQKTLVDWKKELRQQLTEDKQQDLDRQWENKAMEKIIEVSTFGELPEALIKGETDKMLHELQHSVESNRMKWEDYLNNMKKTTEQMLTEFIPTAENRVKAALSMRQIAVAEKLSATREEIAADLKAQEQQYAADPKALEVIHSRDYQQYLENTLVNRKVMKLIREAVAENKK